MPPVNQNVLSRISMCFGENRLMQIVDEQGHSDVDELRGQILRDIEHFAGGAPQHDDMTMLVLKVGAPAA